MLLAGALAGLVPPARKGFWPSIGALLFGYCHGGPFESPDSLRTVRRFCVTAATASR